ncbi:MAG: GNAT family N-acetyltransferase [Clostridia bacterium]|nr:GNAT family N-acetyltransferase [Clostridia bacterium]
MELKRLEELDRARVNAFLISRWFSLEMLVHGETIDLSNVQGKAILESEEIIGMITWRTLDDALEILSLDSLHEGQGIGTILLEQAVAEAKKQRLRRLVLTTTNDALRALRFYQRRGFDLLCLRRGAVDEARKKKPQIPLTGENGIPLHHEIDLERIL